MQLWVLLVEKAYAKLCGSYYNLRWGFAHEALIDLTGCPTLNINFADRRISFEDILCWDRNDCLICAGTPGEDTVSESGVRPKNDSGLVAGHAYTILQARRITKKGPYQGAEILQLRNPWGAFEWSGAWSDSSKELKSCKAELDDDGITTNDGSSGDDGLFWMSFKDFITHFCDVSVCAVHCIQLGATFKQPRDLHTLPSSDKLSSGEGKSSDTNTGSADKGKKAVGKRKQKASKATDAKARYVPPRRAPAARLRWHESRQKSYFDAAAACLRPAHCFLFTVTASDDGERVPCFITLSQVDERVPSASGYVDTGLVLFRVGHEGDELVEVEFAACAALRNVLLEAYLDSGTYLCVPVTGGVRPSLPKLETELTENPLNLESQCVLPGGVQACLSRVFFALDQDMDNRLKPAELHASIAKPFLTAVEDVISPADYPDGISYEELELALLSVWGADSCKWITLLGCMGYDEKQLRPSAALAPLVVSLHSPLPIALQRVELPAQQSDATVSEVVRLHGKAMTMGPLSLHTMNTSHGVVFAASNAGEVAKCLEVDCSGSQNMRSTVEGLQLKASVVIPANSNQLLLGLAVDNSHQAFSWTYKCKSSAAKDEPGGAVESLMSNYRTLLPGTSAGGEGQGDATSAGHGRGLDLGNEQHTNGANRRRRGGKKSWLLKLRRLLFGQRTSLQGSGGGQVQAFFQRVPDFSLRVTDLPATQLIDDVSTSLTDGMHAMGETWSVATARIKQPGRPSEPIIPKGMRKGNRYKTTTVVPEPLA